MGRVIKEQREEWGRRRGERRNREEWRLIELG